MRLLALLLLVTLSLPARAQEPPDLLPPAAAVDPAAQKIQEALEKRRTLLRVHQLAGFSMLAALGATVVLGQLNYLDKYAGGGDTERWQTPHKIAAYTATGLFVGTGALALLAPSPTEKPLRLDSATVHKALMFTAAAGMAAEIALGIVAAGKSGQISQRDWALAHQVLGYGTFLAATGGFVALTF